MTTDDAADDRPPPAPTVSTCEEAAAAYALAREDSLFVCALALVSAPHLLSRAMVCGMAGGKSAWGVGWGWGRERGGEGMCVDVWWKEAENGDR